MVAMFVGCAETDFVMLHSLMTDDVAVEVNFYI